MKPKILISVQTTIAIWLWAFITFCQSAVAIAQDESQRPESDADSARSSTTNGDTAPNPENDISETEMNTASKKVDASDLTALQQRLSELERKSASDSEKIAELSERLDIQEESDILEISEKEMALRAYGFIDIQFSKFFIKKGTFYKDYLPDSTTFTLGHWNLFLKKSLSPHFSILGEVRFLFQPMGEENDWRGFNNTEYSRVKTRATDIVDNHFFNWGAISIQRAYIQYLLNDYFGIRVGYYLTPYGIWNEEHASPVILFAHRPFLSTAGHFPEAQLGLYLFGQAFGGDRLSFKYGFTVSNGRGPTAEVYDLDENKGMGLTLQATYDGPLFFNAGTYLYMGDYTDISRDVALPQVDFMKTTTVAYSEKVMSIHLKLQWKGVLVQGEYVRRLIEYDDGKRETADHGQGIIFSPDHVRNGTYEIIAYTLPIEVVNITPYVLHEYKDMPVWAEYWAGHSVGGGVNWRIIPSTVLKIEGIHNKHRKENGFNADFEMLIVQLAASY